MSERHPGDSFNGLGSKPSSAGGTEFNAWYAANRNVVIGALSLREWAKVYASSMLPRNASLRSTNRIYDVRTSIASMTWKRKLMGSEAGRPVLAPEAALPGDWLCVLSESPAPVVLRKVADHFMLIGECYVDDMMQRNQRLERMGGAGKTVFEIR
jgi:hypothetical protein